MTFSQEELLKLFVRLERFGMETVTIPCRDRNGNMGQQKWTKEDILLRMKPPSNYVN